MSGALPRKGKQGEETDLKRLRQLLRLIPQRR